MKGSNVSFFVPRNIFANCKVIHLPILSKYPDIDTHIMGFPENWQEELLWQ